MKIGVQLRPASQGGGTDELLVIKINKRAAEHAILHAIVCYPSPCARRDPVTLLKPYASSLLLFKSI